MSGTVNVRTDGLVRTVEIDNPDKRNALTPSMLDTIAETFDGLDDSDVRVAVLTATGTESFSAGFDISQFDEGLSPDETERSFGNAVNSIYECDYPTIAMINGDVIGGGVEVVAACDLRISVEDARYGITPAKLGIIYTDRGVHHFLNGVGAMNTKELLFTADLVGAERVDEMGLLTRLVPREELEETTYDLAENIAGNAPLSLKGMKKVVRAILDKRKLTDAERRWVRGLREEAYDSRDHAEAKEAFAEGRTPEFEGR